MESETRRKLRRLPLLVTNTPKEHFWWEKATRRDVESDNFRDLKTSLRFSEPVAKIYISKMILRLFIYLLFIYSIVIEISVSRSFHNSYYV